MKESANSLMERMSWLENSHHLTQSINQKPALHSVKNYTAPMEKGACSDTMTDASTRFSNQTTTLNLLISLIPTTTLSSQLITLSNRESQRD